MLSCVRLRFRAGRALFSVARLVGEGPVSVLFHYLFFFPLFSYYRLESDTSTNVNIDVVLLSKRSVTGHRSLVQCLHEVAPFCVNST